MDKKYEAIFENLYADNYKKLLKYVYQVIRNREATEEIVQETFLTAFRRIDIIAEHENPIGWLYVTAKTLIKAYFRENQIRMADVSLDNLPQGVNDESIDSLILLSGVSDREADMLKKHYIMGMPLEELAKQDGISLSACKMRLKRARDKLKE